MDEFLYSASAEPINIDILARDMGVPVINIDTLIENLKRVFGIG